jgi:phosphoenolpyruvate carboxykinase (GTP)
MVDYFRHWLNVGGRLKDPPKIFLVNWFKKDAQGMFIWPGFRENFRLITWILDRAKGTIPARETPIGFMPNYADLNLSGLDIPQSTFDRLFEVNPDEWKKEIKGIEAFYGQLGDRLPQELTRHLLELKRHFS